MTHILYTSIVHKTASLADEDNSAYCQSRHFAHENGLCLNGGTSMVSLFKRRLTTSEFRTYRI